MPSDSTWSRAVPARLADLAKRLYAFELLVGPYAVAHLRISQRLQDEQASGGPANVYLTDTLESPNSPSEFTASLLQEQMNRDRDRAQKIKRDVPIVVCLGNPPYDREQHDLDEEGQRKGGWVRYGDDGSGESPILDDFLTPGSEAGAGVHLKNLYNDYVYFWRWALWKIFESTRTEGIVAFITASSYLRGPGFHSRALENPREILARAENDPDHPLHGYFKDYKDIRASIESVGGFLGPDGLLTTLSPPKGPTQTVTQTVIPAKSLPRTRYGAGTHPRPEPAEGTQDYKVRRTRKQRRRDGAARAATLGKHPSSERNNEEKQDKPAPVELTPAERRIKEKLERHWHEPDPWAGPIDSTTPGRSPPW